MSAVTVLLGVLIVSVLIGHAALHYTRTPSAREIKKPVHSPELFVAHDPLEPVVPVEAVPRSRGEGSTLLPGEMDVLRDKIRMAHARLDRLEQQAHSIVPGNDEGEIELRLRSLENAAENSKVDLIAIKQILQNIQSRIKR